MHGWARWVVAAALVAATVTWTNDADAQRRRGGEAGQSRIGAHALFGFGGEADFDFDGSSIFDGDDDLETTFGFGLVFEHAVHRYFLLGGRFEAGWWLTESWDDSDVDRSVVLDFSPQAKGRYPFDLGGAQAEVSVTVPFGLTVSLPDDDIAGDWDTGVGFNVGILGGFAVMLEGGFGFYTEMGWRWHTVYHEEQDAEIEVDVSTSQFVMHFGMMLGL